MYICNKCGKETQNPSMICDFCNSNSEIEINSDRQYAEDRLKNIIKEKQKEDKENKFIENANLMFCSDCGNKISKNALQCPHCGKPYIKEKDVLKSPVIKFISDVTIVISFFIPYGLIIPIIWGIGFLIYYWGGDKEKYNLDYYKNASKQSFISAIIIIFIRLLLLFIYYVLIKGGF